jgi:ion channel-forming bestrophin family protein
MPLFSNFLDIPRSFIKFHRSSAIQALMRRVLLFGLYTVVLTVIQINFFPIEVKIDTIFISLLGTLLSLLLVFRTNTAYDRFWEGRKQWGSLVNHSRSFAMMMNAMLAPSDESNRTFFAKYLSGFAFAFKGHLRDNIIWQELEGLSDMEKETLQKKLHVPNAIAANVFVHLQNLVRQNVLTELSIRNVKSHHEAIVDITGACERIKRTPIPHSYGFYIELFITVYVGILPFMLIDKYGYYTVIAVMMAAYALMGIEMIAREIEEPFGLDANDLPLDQMSQTIRLNVHEILDVGLPNHDF